MKKFYSLVVSVLDEDGNRIETIEIVSSNNKKQIKSDRNQLEKRINKGEFDKYANFEDGETLSADIEVHDDESYELLWIE